ncbi:MAG: hypothetical protein J6K37_02525 [Lachnospiraceae bacterium]|nr:hypothetical protein [Lachnospiraceae bacterium]
MSKARIEELAMTLGDMLKRQEEVKEEKKSHTLLWVFAIIGAIAAIAAIAYAVYRYFTPDYLEDFEDDFDDDFDDDFFADDEEEVVVETASAKEDAEASEE